MSFDFLKQYKGYSNIELLKIVKRPDDYQPEAVQAAIQILNDRTVTSEETEYINNYYQDIDKKNQSRKEKTDQYKKKTVAFFEPIINPSEKVEPKKWINILLLVIALQYAWALFETIRRLIRFLKCDYCRWDFIYILDILPLLYVPIIFFLIYKRKRWGWILLFADNLFIFIARVSQSYIFFKYQNIHHGDTTSFLFGIFVKAAFIFFLWRNSVVDYFNVNTETKIKTAVVVTVGTLTFLIATYLTYGV